MDPMKVPYQAERLMLQNKLPTRLYLLMLPKLPYLQVL